MRRNASNSKHRRVRRSIEHLTRQVSAQFELRELARVRSIQWMLVIGCCCLLFSGGCRSFRRTPIDESAASSRELTLLGIEAMRQGRLEEAESHFSEAVRICPEDDRSRKRLAEVLVKQGAVDQAIEQMDRAVHLSGGAPDHLVDLGVLYFARGDVDIAEELANRALSEDYQLAKGWALKGQISENRQRPDDALKHYHRALGIQPQMPDVQMSVARIYQSQSRPLRAYSTLRRYIQEASEWEVSAEAFAMQGAALIALGRDQQAVDSYVQAVERDPNSSQLRIQLADAQWKSGEEATAQLTMRRAREQFPYDQAVMQVAEQMGISVQVDDVILR